MKKLYIFLMKRSLFLILLLGYAMLFSSCAGYTANAPAGPFSRDDWDACGFEPWAGIDEFEARFVLHDGVCGDGDDTWINDYTFGGGTVSISCRWIIGEQFKRLYTNYSFRLNVSDPIAGVGLPRGLKIGSTFEDAVRIFALGESGEDGLYYGDGENAPYAKYEVLKYESGSKKAVTFVVSAGDSDDTGDRYICSFILVFDPQDRLEYYTYGATRMYSILPGLPEPGQVEEVRIYSTGEAEPETVISYEDAVDLLACIQDAGQSPVQGDVVPTHSIEICAGEETFTLLYGNGLIETLNGRTYEMLDYDKWRFFHSAPGLLESRNLSMRASGGHSAELSEQQAAAVNDILGAMSPCDDPVPEGDAFSIIVQDDGFYRFTYYIGTEYMVFEYEEPVYMTGLFTISAGDAQTLEQIYKEVFRE